MVANLQKSLQWLQPLHNPNHRRGRAIHWPPFSPDFNSFDQGSKTIQ